MRILKVGEVTMDRAEQTRDISSGGVRFVSPTSVNVGGRIEYVITLSGCNPPVRIRCLGMILRCVKPRTGEQYEIAVTMERYTFLRAAAAAA